MSDPSQVESIFFHALEKRDAAERSEYLDRACGDDAALRLRVQRLLDAHAQAGGFLAQPAVDRREHDLPEPPGATRMAASDETVPGSWVSAPDDVHATVGAAGVRSLDGMIADVTRVDGPDGFVPGRVIGGRYTLLEVLGEGGMGTVYRAEQSQPVKRQVALKLIKLGMDSRTVLARFDAERQALAMMDHPNIARVYDGGATETNQPFFVMEFVQGVPITDYCDRHRLSVDARLQLFVAVCQAVQHAHQKGIIHRDLKPSNVMVTEVDGRATPKVIDFGVAKATEFDLTDQSLGDTGAIVGTPTYMSPEQADPSSMDIDTRTDVYALGVILYELLAGSTPLDAAQFRRGAILEMLRMVREVDPSKPSTKVSSSEALPSIAANRGIDPERLKRELRGDLDWIVMKALEKDRTRRYETANGLGADILRHLASDPVLAAPPSRSYRLRKFVRKHRVGVIAASLVLVALVAGIAGTTLGLFEARRQETRANERTEGERLAKQKALEAAEGERLAKQKALAAAEEEKKAKETVEAVLGFVENKVFAAARPEGQDGGLGHEVRLADAITAALPAIEKGFPDKPRVEARLRTSIGITFLYLGKPDLMAGQFEAALALYRRDLGPDHPVTLTSMNDLANSYDALGRYAEALKLHEKAFASQKAILGPDHPDTLTSMGNLAFSYRALGRPVDAVKVSEEVLAQRKAKYGPDHPDTLWSMNNLAGSYFALGRHADALKLSEETLAQRKARLGPDHPDTLMSMNNLARIYAILGRNGDALKLREETLTLQKARLGPDHPNTLNSMNNLAFSYVALGRNAEALKLREETLALRKVKLGPDHPDTLVSTHNLANSYAALGQHAEALKLFEDTLALQKAKLGPDHPDTLSSMNNLALSYLANGRRGEALSLLEVAAGKDTENFLTLAAVQAWFGEGDAYSATRQRFLASARETKDGLTARRATLAGALRPSTDRAQLEAVLALGRKAEELGKGQWERLALGMAEFRDGHLAAADEPLSSAAKAGQDGNAAAIAAFYRAMCLFQQGKKDEAREVATQAAARMEPLPRDEQKPAMPHGSDDLILWLAYKEAKALIGFDPPPAATAPDAK